MKTAHLAKKSPHLAALLVFIFGPIGFFYLGWQLVIACIMMLASFYLIVTLMGFGWFLSIWWVDWIIFGFIAYKAYSIVSAAKESILFDEDYEEIFGSGYSFALIMMSDTMTGIAMGLATAAGLYMTIISIFVEKKVLLGLVMFFIGTPALVYLANMIFGFIAMMVDSLALAGRESRLKKQVYEKGTSKESRKYLNNYIQESKFLEKHGGLTMKKCPFCEEEIPSESEECPYCAEVLIDVDKEIDSAHEEEKEFREDEVVINKDKENLKKEEQKEKNVEAVELIEELNKFIHRKWYSKCLQKDYIPTFIMSVILVDDNGDYVDGRLFASGSTKIVKFHVDGLLENVNKVKGEFIKW
ncbi:MAG: hypothetical protein U9O41_06215 [Candidatus Aerophobetes bacterium]|nr:hypothetical protein [Candidatus Aerophobetes bacterium]